MSGRHVDPPGVAGANSAAVVTDGGQPDSVSLHLGSSVETGYVWRGFEHNWEYNHRLNRFGSYVRQSRPDEDHQGWVVGHAAASGTGDDIAHFEDYYTGIDATGVAFASGTVVLPIDTTKTNPASIQREVFLRLDAPSLDRDRHAVLINGFDVVAVGDANKLMTFDLHVGEPTRRDDDCLRFPLTCEFTADCHTPECSTDSSTDYLLVAHLLVVAGDADDFHATRLSPVSLEHHWTTEDELPDSAGDTSVTVPDPRPGEAGRRTVGLNRVSLSIERPYGPAVFDITASMGYQVGLPDFGPWNDLARDGNLPITGEAVHLLAWDTAVLDVDCDDGDCELDLRLFFKNWRAGMFMADYPDVEAFQEAMSDRVDEIDATRLEDLKGDFGEIPASMAALRDDGHATVEVGQTLLHFADPNFYREGSESGTLYWPGGGESAASRDAVRERTLPGPGG